MSRPHPTGLLTAVILLAVPPLTRGAEAQEFNTMDLESLGVIPAFEVYVTGIDEVAEADGLLRDSVVAQVRRMLKEASIRSLSVPQWQQVIGNPSLQINFRLLKPSEHLYLYHVGIEVKQLIKLIRDSTKIAYGTTWKGQDLLGTVPTAQLPDLYDKLRGLVQDFVAAYHSATGRTREQGLEARS